MLSPQGKYLFDFFVIKKGNGYLLDCDGKSTKDLISNLSKYIIRSKVEIKDFKYNLGFGKINIFGIYIKKLKHHSIGTKMLLSLPRS